MAGQEIYATLRERSDVDIEVESLAASAASVIAMAGPCTISPIGMMMVHNVSVSGARGNKHDMKKEAEVLAAYDETLANAYVMKTGMSRDEVLKLMDKETWLTAERAVELGFADAITEAGHSLNNSTAGMRVTDEMVAQYKAHKAEEEKKASMRSDILSGLDKFGTMKGE
jgi:ATP-dependent protease ClpP protease subunit